MAGTESEPGCFEGSAPGSQEHGSPKSTASDRQNLAGISPWFVSSAFIPFSRSEIGSRTSRNASERDSPCFESRKRRS